jgi:hypothetical protein
MQIARGDHRKTYWQAQVLEEINYRKIFKKKKTGVYRFSGL